MIVFSPLGHCHSNSIFCFHMNARTKIILEIPMNLLKERLHFLQVVSVNVFCAKLIKKLTCKIFF